MKSFPSRSARPAAKDSEGKITISKHDLETMIQQEIHNAMKKKEKQLDVQIESAEQGMSYEKAVKLLEARMNTVAKRADAALAHMTDVNKSNENAVKEIEQLRERNEQLCGINDQLCASNERLCASNEALTAAVTNLREDNTHSCSPSPIPRPQSRVIEGLAKLIKKEPENSENAYTPTATVQLKRPKVEVHSPEDGRLTKRIKTEPTSHEELPFPPLPPLPMSSSSAEAEKYSLPSRVQLKLVLIKNPPQLTVIWDLDEEKASAPPMKSYSVFYTSEQAMGSSDFHDWKNLGEHPAVPLPMFSVIHNYNPGHKICVTVVGKDTFGRYGPYSKVECSVL